MIKVKFIKGRLYMYIYLNTEKTESHLISSIQLGYTVGGLLYIINLHDERSKVSCMRIPELFYRGNIFILIIIIIIISSSANLNVSITFRGFIIQSAGQI